MNEELESLEESLKHAIHVLAGVLADVQTGTYTQEQAALDAENLMYTEGLDFISTLTAYSEGKNESNK